MSIEAAAADALSFACPRCGTEVRERFYGPCGACRDQLGFQQRFRGGEVAAERFEPKMNVVPNHVATKE
jgi:hypothetical protein